MARGRAVLDVATRKGWFCLARTESGWRVARYAFAGVPVTALARDPHSGRLVLALRHGHYGVKLHASDDSGATFEEIASPRYPPRPAEATRASSDQEWSTDMVWCLEPGGDGGRRLWAGTIPGGLFVSGDAGASFELVRSLWDRPERAEWFGGGYDHPGIHSIAVDPRDEARLTVAVSCGGVWVSGDGGESWSLSAEGMRADYMPAERAEDPRIQDPHRLVQCRADPKVMWVQHHNGIFRTADGAAHWHPIERVEPSDFGFAVAVSPTDPDTAWFVPAASDQCRIPVDGRLVVTRTTDGGRHVEVLDRGLPSGPAYDLVYRHALDVAADGELLAFGSTTGGLWIGEGGGETWRDVGVRFSPVYAVRFAPPGAQA